MQRKKNFYRYIYQRRRHKLKASVLINVLFVTCLVSMLILDAFNLSKNEINNFTNRNNAYSLQKEIESNIIDTLYDTEFKKALSIFLYHKLDLTSRNLYIFNNNMKFNNEDFQISIMGNNEESPNKAIFCIEKRMEKKGAKSKYQAFCKLYDERYQIENGLICINSKSNASFFIKAALDNIYEYAKNFEENILDLYYANEFRYKKIYDSNYQIEVYNGSGTPFITNINKSELIVLNSLDKENKMNFVFDKNKGLSGVRGIIAINGDLIVDGEIHFKGIIIMNGGDIIVNDGKRLLVSGLVISTKPIDQCENLTINFNHEFLIKYGLLIPNFVDISLFSIRNGGI